MPLPITIAHHKVMSGFSVSDCYMILSSVDCIDAVEIKGYHTPFGLYVLCELRHDWLRCGKDISLLLFWLWLSFFCRCFIAVL